MTKPVLWVVSELFYPETTSTGYFLTGIAEGLAKRFDVRALCSRPTYSERGQAVRWQEVRAGVHIRRLRSTSFAKDFLPGRLLNMATFSVAVALAALIRIRRGDQVLVVTNPPLAAILIGLVLRLRGIGGVLLVHDVYPEVLYATGHLRPGGWLSERIGRATNLILRSYDEIVVLGRDMAELLRQKVGEDRRITFIPNWGDPDDVQPMTRLANPFAHQYDLVAKTVVQFSGNLGRTHDVETVLEAAHRLRDRDRLRFLFVGYGGKMGIIEQAAERLGNILLAPRQPRNMLGPMLSCSDVTIIGFTDGMVGVSVPSRMYNVMAAAVSIVAMADERSEVAQVVREEECGWTLPVGDVDGLCSLLEQIDSDAGRAEASRRGAAGRDAMLRRYTANAAIEQFARLFAART